MIWSGVVFFVCGVKFFGGIFICFVGDVFWILVSVGIDVGVVDCVGVYFD